MINWLILPFSLWFAILNRARGSQLFGYVNSTVEGRLVSMGLMALTTALLVPLHFLTVFPWTFATLMLWCSPRWDALWAKTIAGSNRILGLAELSVRMLLAAPCIIGLAYLSEHMDKAWLALATAFLAVPYYIFGYLTPGANVIRNSELAAGAILGALVFMTVV